MRRWLPMVRKDLLRQARQPLGIALLLAFPVIFSLLIAISFGGSGQVTPKIDLLVEDRDDTLVSGLFVGALAGDQFAEYARVTEVGDDGQARMESGDASALLRIPAGFSESFLAGRPVALELVRNPSQGILPEIAEQMFTVAVDVLDTGAHLLGGPLRELTPLVDSQEGPTEAEVLQLSSAVYRLVDEAAPLLFPPVVGFESVRLEEEGPADNPGGGGSIFLFVLPGISVWALFALGDLTMRDVLREGLAGTLRRQLVAPVRVHDIVIAKALFTAVVAAASVVVLAGVGVAVLDRPVSPAGFLLLSASVVVAVTGSTALIYGLARNERQGATVANVLFLFFAFLGGSFVPLSSMPAAVRGAAPFSPFYWGVSGFTRLIQEGAGVSGVLVNVAVLCGLGLAMLLLGSRFLAAKVRSGATA